MTKSTSTIQNPSAKLSEETAAKTERKQQPKQKLLLAPREVDDTLKELGAHGSFELPIETYTDNCVIFHSLYNHWHKEMEIMMIENGSGLAQLNRETLRLGKGDILMINSGALHSMKTDLKNILYYKSIVFDLNYLRGPAGDLCEERLISLLAENKAEFTHLITPGDENYDKLFRLFYDIHDCYRNKKPFYFVELKALLYQFFYQMLVGNYIIPAAPEESKNVASIKSVLNYINEHYREDLTMRGLTEISNYSEYYFMKIFKQYTGKSLSSYLNDFRLEKSKSLLLHSDRSVTDIAMEVGFNTTSYFIKKFQQANGISPHKFRKNLS